MTSGHTKAQARRIMQTIAEDYAACGQISEGMVETLLHIAESTVPLFVLGMGADGGPNAQSADPFRGISERLATEAPVVRLGALLNRVVWAHLEINETADGTPGWVG